MGNKNDESEKFWINFYYSDTNKTSQTTHIHTHYKDTYTNTRLSGAYRKCNQIINYSYNGTNMGPLRLTLINQYTKLILPM